MLERNSARTLRLHRDDNVLVAAERIEPGVPISPGLATGQRIPFGHKVAARADRRRRAGPQVRPDHRLRQPADRAPATGCTSTIATWVRARRFERDYQFAQAARAEHDPAGRGAGDVPGLPPRQRQGRHAQLCRHPDQRELLGHGRRLHRRGDQPLGHPRRLSRTSTASSPFVHGTGCGMDDRGEGFDIAEAHAAGAMPPTPIIGGVLMVGLGCEVFQIAALKEAYGIEESETFRTMTIQETGGTQEDRRGGRRARSRRCCRSSTRARRETLPASELMLALQCGGSDGYSGITANPALGVAADILVRTAARRSFPRRRRSTAPSTC